MTRRHGNRKDGRSNRPGNGLARAQWIGVTVTLAVVLLAWWQLPVEALIIGGAEVVVELGLAGVALFAVVYVVTVLALGPAWALSAVAGLAYGFAAVPLVLVVATTGAAAGFFLARLLGRRRVAAWLEARPRIRAVERATRAHGFNAVLLLRLSPALPFGAKSYILGVTGVPAGIYLAATLLGIIPGTIFYVYLGVAGRLTLGGGPQQDPLGWGLAMLGLAATGAVVVLITRDAQRRLRELEE